MRLIVTGSRDWPYPDMVVGELNDVLRKLRAAHGLDARLVIVHGDCPTGADRHADEWVTRMQTCGFNVSAERHPADWKTHGKAAGPLRNQEMVDRGADKCLAFQLGWSRGTQDCLDRALKADIPVKRIQLTISELRG